VLKTSTEKKAEAKEAEKEKAQPEEKVEAKAESQQEVKESADGEPEGDEEKKSWMEIGTWSNELAAMASNPQPQSLQDDDELDPNSALPGNLTLLGGDTDIGSTGWGEVSKTKAWDSPPPTTVSFAAFIPT